MKVLQIPHDDPAWLIEHGLGGVTTREQWRSYWHSKGVGGSLENPLPMHPLDTCGSVQCPKCGETGWGIYPKDANIPLSNKSLDGQLFHLVMCDRCEA